MKITEFRIGAARTINLGNFESLRIEAALSVEIGEGDDVTAARAEAQTELRAMLEETYRIQHKKAQQA